MPYVLVTFDLVDAEPEDYKDFYECLSKKDWRRIQSSTTTVCAKFKDGVSEAVMQATTKTDFQKCADAIGKDYSATAAISDELWKF